MKMKSLVYKPLLQCDCHPQLSTDQMNACIATLYPYKYICACVRVCLSISQTESGGLTFICLFSRLPAYGAYEADP